MIFYAFLAFLISTTNGQFFPYDPNNPHPEISQPCLDQINAYQNYLASNTLWLERPEWVFKSKK